MFTIQEFHVPKSADVIFVSDMFVEDYVGGAELTMEALIKSASCSVFKLHSRSLTPEIIEANKDKKWILVNYTGMSEESIICMAMECDYVIVECDYKYCTFRSATLCEMKQGKPCSCHQEHRGRLIGGLMARAKNNFFMSAAQKDLYMNLFPKHLNSENVDIQFSTWEPEHLERLKQFRENRVCGDKWAVLGGGSWIKNQAFTEQLMKDKGLDYDVIGGLPYDEFIELLSTYKGLAFHPAGLDTCPRLVIEAHCMGLELDLGDNVQIKNDRILDYSHKDLSSYLDERTRDFWNTIKVYCW